MGLSVQPSFEAIEKLSRTRDADLVGRTLVDSALNRGRGAQSNAEGRFERHNREAFADGWADENPAAVFETVEHIERAKTIISKNQSPDLEFDRSINPYRGCAHGCPYCYARPTHAYLGHSAGLDFERDLYIKVNAAELLKKELAQARYKPRLINLGANTDPYQPLERKHRITRSVLEVLTEARHPVVIVTKSALVVRDLDLLTDLARDNLVRVALSVTSMDHILSRKLEPRASSPAKRLEAIRLLSEAGVPVQVMASPMIPAINDMELERILDAAAAQGAKYASMILLRLPLEVREIFREWLLTHFPNKVSHVMELVRGARGGKDNDSRFGSRFVGEGAYATILQQRFTLAAKRFGLSTRMTPLRTDLFRMPQAESAQLDLFGSSE
ncbi:MAG: PA0069 family radical SAM protein [Hyphomicrobiaceae bacterium]|nr:PA0069 family radical SAM protein [Hyphomicrobiaceae bacterium]MCC0023057.1 PA0069 family radical SAM protein [Hyphomicrobiaceae bacterium]